MAVWVGAPVGDEGVQATLVVHLDLVGVPVQVVGVDLVAGHARASRTRRTSVARSERKDRTAAACGSLARPDSTSPQGQLAAVDPVEHGVVRGWPGVLRLVAPQVRHPRVDGVVVARVVVFPVLPRALVLLGLVLLGLQPRDDRTGRLLVVGGRPVQHGSFLGQSRPQRLDELPVPSPLADHDAVANRAAVARTLWIR
jgi:hypothetical protein